MKEQKESTNQLFLCFFFPERFDSVNSSLWDCCSNVETAGLLQWYIH